MLEQPGVLWLACYYIERAEATGGRMAADERESRPATVGAQRPWWRRMFGE